LTFAKAVELTIVGDCVRSRLSIDESDEFAAERLRQKVSY
jgi:hypothetical protein